MGVRGKEATFEVQALQALERAYCGRIDGLSPEAAHRIVMDAWDKERKSDPHEARFTCRDVWDAASLVDRSEIEREIGGILVCALPPLPAGHPYGDDPSAEYPIHW